MAQIRVLPALIAVSIGALAFKGVDLAKAVAEVANNEPAQPPAAASPEAGHAEEAPPPAGQPATAEGAAKSAEQCIPSTDYAGETGISENEILVLRSLSDRRAQLEEREQAASTQEQLNAAAAKKLEEQIGQLKALEASNQKLLVAMDVKRDERMATLVKTYEGMKPDDAARIFNAMDDKVLVDLSKSMKSSILSGILAKMDVRRAEYLTRMLAELAAAKPPPGAPADANKPTPG